MRDFAGGSGSWDRVKTFTSPETEGKEGLAGAFSEAWRTW